MKRRQGAFALQNLGLSRAPLAFALVREPITLKGPPDLSWFDPRVRRKNFYSQFKSVPRVAYSGMGKTIIQAPDDQSFLEKIANVFVSFFVSIIAPYLAPIFSLVSDVIFSVITAIKDAINTILSAVDLTGMMDTLKSIATTINDTAFKALDWLGTNDVTRWLYKGVDQFAGGYLENVKKMSKLTGDVSRADIHDHLTSMIKVPDINVLIMAEVKSSALKMSSMMLDELGLGSTKLGSMIKDTVIIAEGQMFDGAEITDAFKLAGRTVVSREIESATGLDVAKQEFLASGIEQIASGEIPDIDFKAVEPALNLVPSISVQAPNLNITAGGLSLSLSSPGSAITDPSAFSLDSPEAREMLADNAFNDLHEKLKLQVPNPEEALRMALALWMSRNKSATAQEEAVSMIQRQMPDFHFDFSHLFKVPSKKKPSWWPVLAAAALGTAFFYIETQGD